MGLGIIGNKADDQDSDWQKIANAAKGAGVYVPRMYSDKDVEEAAQRAKDAAGTYKNEQNAGTQGMLAMARAATRDMAYFTGGRKRTLVAGLTRKSLYTTSRGRMLGRFETRTES